GSLRLLSRGTGADPPAVPARVVEPRLRRRPRGSGARVARHLGPRGGLLRPAYFVVAARISAQGPNHDSRHGDPLPRAPAAQSRPLRAVLVDPREPQGLPLGHSPLG